MWRRSDRGNAGLCAQRQAVVQCIELVDNLHGGRTFEAPWFLFGIDLPIFANANKLAV
jgi:hypothetical protein